jgi:O-antigen/teichoic acid export membrane protein
MLLGAMALRVGAIVVTAPHGLLPLFIGIVVAQAISTVSVVAVGYAVFRRFPSAPHLPLGDDRATIRSFAVQSSLASGLTSLRTSLPTVLVGVVASGSQVGNFRIAQAPQTAFQSLSAPARLVLLAEQTRDIEYGRADRALALLRRYVLGTALFSVLVTPPLWIFMPNILRFVYSGKWAAAANPCRVMVLVACVQLIFAWTKTFPVSIGRPGLRLAGQSVEIAVLVPALLVFTAIWGATGAAIGALVSSLALAAFWSVWIVRFRHGDVTPIAVEVPA